MEKGILIYLDILGFSDYINKGFEREDKEKFVKEVQDLLDEFSDKKSPYLKDLKFLLTDETNELTCGAITNFSDSIVITMQPLNKIDSSTFIELTKNLINYISWIQLEMLAKHEMLIRGALVYDYFYHDEKYFFGPAMNRAAKCESEIAKYSRVIVDDEFIKKVEEEIRKCNEPDEDIVSYTEADEQNDNFIFKTLKDFLNENLHRDNCNGKYFINYLHPVHYEFLLEDPKTLFEKHFKAVECYKEKSKLNDCACSVKGVSSSIVEKVDWLVSYHNNTLKKISSKQGWDKSFVDSVTLRSLAKGECLMELQNITQAVILAGGYGTRLKPFTDTNPKPMYPFEGRPFLEHLIEQVKSFGITEIVLLLGYLPEKITDHFGDGSKCGVNIQYSITPVEYETGLRLKAAYNEGKMQEEFLLMYCDNYCPINFNRLCREYLANGAKLQITAYRNADGYTKNNFKIAENGLVEVYDKTRTTPGLQGVDIGYAIVNRNIMEMVGDENENFEKQVYPRLVAEGKMFATVTEHRYYSVGSWERIELTKTFFSPQKFIFLDRDGTLNVRPPKACYIEKPEDFVWLPKARKAVKRLCDAGYKILLVSNQPGIARGRLTEETLSAINQKMQNELQEVGAKIERIYFCPHDWDEGCECRKPKAGMFFQAQKEFSLDLTKCWMLGDDERDMHAGGDAGCKCMLVSEQHPLIEAVEKILQWEEGK